MSLREYLGEAHLVDFHRLALKSDEVIDLLETFEVVVVYDFDRLHEGAADAYSARCLEEGFELRFDEHQVLETIWCHLHARDGHGAMDPASIGVFLPASQADAKRHAVESGERFTEPKPGSGAPAWLRVEREELWIHYEFANGALVQVTLMAPWT